MTLVTSAHTDCLAKLLKSVHFFQCLLESGMPCLKRDANDTRAVIFVNTFWKLFLIKMPIQNDDWNDGYRSQHIIL